ncbi:MAG: DUF2272 domain-containing protein [Thermoleophilia bacterium]|nr:DUF2272 domain-containing protein [Thermoleophilia bacterium]
MIQTLVAAQQVQGGGGSTPAPTDPSVAGGGGTPVQQSPVQQTSGGDGCGCGGDPTQGDPNQTSKSPRTGGDSPPPLPDQSPSKPPATGSTDDALRKKIVDIAAKEIGTKEEGGANKGSRIVDYRKAVTGPGEDPNVAEPWCADFTSWVMKQAGVPIGKDGKGDDYTPTIQTQAKADGRWKPNSFTPKPGDMLEFDWEGDGKVDHIGIVEKVEGGKIFTIEGNSSDQVRRNSYAAGSAKIAGYIVQK